MMNCPHCDIHIDEHSAMPCLSWWVAEVVFGVKKRKPTHGYCCTCQKCGQCHDDCICWYCESISAAWEVHQKACSLPFSKRQEYLRQLCYSVSAREYPHLKELIAWPSVMTFLKPVDFCRAAIKVISG